MIDVKRILTLLACCTCLAVARTSWADFVGVVSEFKVDADTADLCGEANGAYVPFPLTVCNVFIQFDEDDDRLLSMAFADLQVMNGDNPGVFYHHIFGGDTPPSCGGPPAFPDLMCDSFVAIGEKCVGLGTMTTDGDFDSAKFNNNGHIVGGWHTTYPDNGQGDAVNYPDGKVLILQSSVAVGLSLEGSVTIFWHNIGDLDNIFKNEVEIICEAECPEGEVCDDGNLCTADEGICIDGTCVADPIDCNDFNPCTDDSCDPDSGCVNTPNDGPCDDGDACTEGDHCGPDGCIESTPIDCDDGNECTIDSCGPATGCFFKPVDCDDGNPCTTDTCDPEDGCMHIPECVSDLDCDTDNLCSFDTCTHEGCCESTPLECPPGEFCDPDTGWCVDFPSGYLDIIPGKCPNRLRRNGSGFLKVSLVSAASAQDGQPFSACEVDVSTIQLCRADGTWGCAQPASNPAPRCRDRATPFLGELCGCHGLRKDGLDDLDMRFKVADVVNNLGLADMPAGVSVGLELTALTNDGQIVKARDCVELGRDLGPNP